MRTRPILFSGPMVRAILDGRKTQTRRVVKIPQSERRIARFIPSDGARGLWDADGDDGKGLVWHSFACPYGVPGGRLWVRETWCSETEQGTPTGSYIYRATTPEVFEDDSGFIAERADGTPRSPWRPSIHMPREASRITLELTGVRVERLQEISEEDARAEGLATRHLEGREIVWARDQFATLWDSINARRGYSWESNPWVWVLELRRIEERA